MRTARIKVAPEEGEAVYHCMSRTVNGERLFDEAAREALRRQLWKVADYCGVRVVTYAVLSNHFHVVVEVPAAGPVGDGELLRRYGALHRGAACRGRREAAARELGAGGARAEAWRRRQLAMMGDVSGYMKLVKQRFSLWYNRTRGRYGTLWSERFKSVLVEGGGLALRAVAAYVDLNAVRAGLARDPKDYRFCGYAEAVAGRPEARDGLGRAVGGGSWAEVQRDYRLTLFGAGSSPGEGGAATGPARLEEVERAGGRLTLAEALRCRVRYFTDGAALGSREFVARQLEGYRRRTGRRRGSGPRPLPALADWGGLATLRGLRGTGFG
jgi:putative transposase